MEAASGYSVQGGCLCGAVRFELKRAPQVAGYCHCTRCQRRTGSAASVTALVEADAFEWLSGEDVLSGWLPPDGGNEKCYCSQCGAHVIARPPQNAGYVGVRMSAFDEDPGVRPSYRQFVDYAASWEPIPEDGLLRYPEARPR